MTHADAWPHGKTGPQSQSMATSLGLAALVLGAWLAIHVSSIFFIDWSTWPMWLGAILIIAVQTWLSVGLFIIAHDTMHGSLAPSHPGINRMIGRLCVILYAGFSYAKLYESHHAHHRHAGTADDPDFDAEHHASFWPWYMKFFRHYFGWKEFLVLTAVLVIYAWVLGLRFPVVLAFWAVPAIASSVQLFYFGTYRPHRVEAQPFTDQHRARSEDFSWLLSLLTCFHFGYHHEHHNMPWVPWWKLPAARRPGKTQPVQLR